MEERGGEGIRDGRWMGDSTVPPPPWARRGWLQEVVRTGCQPILT